MNLASLRAGVSLFIIAMLLQSCGGGGGDDSANGSGREARLSVDTTSVVVSGEPGESAQAVQINATIRNPPETGLWAYVSTSHNGLQDAWFEWTSASEAVIHLQFRAPAEVENDRYEDDVRFYVCSDDACEQNVQGSPATIHAIYDVDGGTRAALSTNQVESQVDARDENNHQEIVQLELERPIENAGYYEVTHSRRAIGSAHAQYISPTRRDIYINYKRGIDLAQGSHEDFVRVKVCYTSDCIKELEGSPYRIDSVHDVTVFPEPGFEELQVASRVPLGHDVIDAEFSRVLNRIVMVSHEPVDALYVYDVATGVEQQQLLVSAPVAVSIGPDGLNAAVGHDDRISIVDLTAVGQVGAPAPLLLDISIAMSDIVLDGLGAVHVFPSEIEFEPPHSVDIATNTEQVGTGLLFRATRARLHPSGNAFYEARTISTPTNIAKWDISTGIATRLYESAYHGIYEVCGDLWYSEIGDRIFTACGNIFSASSVEADDLQYAGTLELTDGAPSLYTFLIRRLSHNAARNEIVLIETTAGCESPFFEVLCYTHLAFYEGDSLARQGVYAIQPMTVDDVIYPQLGHHVYHDATNGRKYLISRLEGMEDPAAAFYLSVIE